MKYIKIIFISLTVFPLTTIVAQKNDLKNAQQKYDKFAYAPSKEHYLKAVKKGNDSAKTLQELGDTYYFDAKFDKALKWYAQLVEIYGEEVEAEYLFRYAQTLKTSKNYKLADKIMDMFYAKNPKDSRGVKYKSDLDYLKTIENNSYKYDVELAKINTSYSDFAPTFYLGNIIFASNSKANNTAKQLASWNNMPFYDLFLASDNEITNFSSVINTDLHESTAVFTKDKKTVYFTRNNYTGKKIKKNAQGLNLLKLYKSNKDEAGTWSKPKELPFNSDEYSVGHPALSPDETTLYFVSDKEGGKGFSDIYSVSIGEENTYGEPKNIEAINTEGRETFPFIDKDGNLFFSSDSHNGLGGLDIFVTSITNDFKEVTNLGKPVNSSYDDFTFIYKSENNIGYFASNRPDGVGLDDIYKVKLSNKVLNDKCLQPLTGIIKDEKTFKALVNTKVILLDKNENILSETVSDKSGAFKFDSIDCSEKYTLNALKEGYNSNSKSFITTNKTNTLVPQTVLLSTIDIKVGDDLAKLLNLNPIYFDFDKSFIRPDAEIELNKIVAILKAYPNMTIDVRSHTDSRGNDAYNLSLSKRRNTSTIKYIIDNEINNNRISGRGYGETKLANKCANGVHCNEGLHQLNRRSEFIVLKIN